MRTVRIGDRHVGSGHLRFTVAETGISDNGNIDLAKRSISGAIAAAR
jgi:sialic acid synthase SpsE